MLNKKIIILIGLIVCNSSIQSFTTLSEARQYAETQEEYPDIDNNDWLNPDFSSFHKKGMPTRFDRMLVSLRLKKKPLWSIHELKKLLRVVASKREKEAFYGRFVQKILPKPGMHFIIFGDVHGAFHSVVRDLTLLKEQGIIDEQFKIIKPDYYIVFNGDVIDRSSFNLEILTLVLRLMDVNPDIVLYIRGGHEDKEHWHNYGLRRELEIRAVHISKEKIPLERLVKRFFNTLPLALYLIADQTETAIDVVRFSNYGRDFSELNEKRFAGFLESTNKKNNVFKVENKWLSSKVVNVKVIIKGEHHTLVFRPTKGLKLIERDRGSVAWTFLSAPTSTFRRLYQFFHDAFGVLTIYPRLEDWTLTLYNQDVRDGTGFKKDGEFNLLSGREVEATVPMPKKEEPKKEAVAPKEAIGIEKDNEIVVGTSVDLSKGLQIVGKQVVQGLDLVFKKANEAGGIKNKKLTLVALDDEYVPKLARANVGRFLREFKTNVLLGPSGSATVESYLDLIKAGDVLVVFTDGGSTLFRKPDLRNIINLRVSYADAANVVTSYVINNSKVKKIVFFYQDDAFGKGALEGSRKVLKGSQIKYWEIPYRRNDLNFNAQIKKIREIAPDAIGFFATTMATREFMRGVGFNSLTNIKMFGLDIGDEVFRKLLKEKGLPFIFTNFFPNPETSQLEIAKEFRKDAEKNNVPIDIFSLEGYIDASIFVDFLKKIKGPITKDKIIDVAENIHDYNFKGLKLDFDPSKRQLLHSIWLDTGKDEWLKIDIKADVKKEIKEEEIKDIIFGTTVDLSKGIKVLGNQVKEGLLLRFEQENRRGGINGKKLELIILDDEYKPTLARENIKKLIDEYDISLILSPLGSPTFEAYLYKIEKKEVAVLMPITGVSSFHRSDLRNVVFFRPSYFEEGKILTTYIFDTEKAKNFLFFYQNDVFGLDSLKGARSALSKAGIEKWTEVSYERDDLNFEHQIGIIKKNNPDAIGFFSTGTAAMGLIRQIGPEYLSSKKLFGISDLGEDFFKKFIKDKGVNVIIANITPNPESDIELAKEFRGYVKGIGSPLSTFSFEGYINASIVIEALKKIKGPITADKILTELENMRNVSLKGIDLNFDKKTRELSNILWLDIGKEVWKKVYIKPD